MKKTVELIENRRAMAMFETKPRYDVMFRGRKVDQLYWNMRGYVGYIPFPSDTAGREYDNLNIGERGIAEFRREVAIANRQWAERS